MTGLLISDVPILTLANVQADIRDAIHWLTHRPVTQEDVMTRDQLVVRLHQSNWHVTNVLRGELL